MSECYKFFEPDSPLTDKKELMIDYSIATDIGFIIFNLT